MMARGLSLRDRLHNVRVWHGLSRLEFASALWTLVSFCAVALVVGVLVGVALGGGVA